MAHVGEAEKDARSYPPGWEVSAYAICTDIAHIIMLFPVLIHRMVLSGTLRPCPWAFPGLRRGACHVLVPVTDLASASSHLIPGRTGIRSAPLSACVLAMRSPGLT